MFGRKRYVSILFLALFGTAWLAPLDAPAATPAYDQLEDWFVACDNVRSCEANGFQDGSDSASDFRVDRDGGPNAKLTAEFNAPFAFGFADIKVDDKPLVFDKQAWKLEKDSDFSTLSTNSLDAIRRLLSQLRGGHTVTLGSGYGRKIPLSGMVSAIRRMDERQGRTGTVTALLDPGTKPAATVPPSPPMPVLKTVVAKTPMSGAEKAAILARVQVASRALYAKEDCDVAAQHREHEDEGAYALDDAHAVAFTPCATGAYQTAFFVFIIPRHGKGLPQRFEPVLNVAGKGIDRSPQSLLLTVDFDPKTATLYSLSKGRGLTDCGMSAAWRWTRQGFQLDSLYMQYQCGGSGPGDWPTLYQAAN